MITQVFPPAEIKRLKSEIRDIDDEISDLKDQREGLCRKLTQMENDARDQLAKYDPSKELAAELIYHARYLSGAEIVFLRRAMDEGVQDRSEISRLNAIEVSHWFEINA